MNSITTQKTAELPTGEDTTRRAFIPLSAEEWRQQLLAHSSASVIDIREQYPIYEARPGWVIEPKAA